MRLRFVWTGKTRDAHLRALLAIYLERLKHFVNCEINELPEAKNCNKRAGIDADSRRILDALRTATVTVLMDENGKQCSSRELATRLQRWANSGTREIAFVVGGPNGVSEQLASQTGEHWSLSRLTLTHEMARVLLMEQLYRAYTINNGIPYQK
jgi:23S rRNA (pseudouridine1915-N3)-methyltransferase